MAPPYAAHMTRRSLRSLVSTSLEAMFDQRTAFGRLALVQVAMLAGDTLVTISLAGSLFFSISPKAAEGKVLLYLLITVAPFAVVSPLLGPAIDASRHARRLVVFVAGAGRIVLCVLMAFSLHSLLLFPEAFCVLVLSKLYLVTRGALVPEMAAIDRRRSHPTELGAETQADAAADADVGEGYAGYNAQLTLLGTLAGFLISLPGIGLLKLFNASAVLIFAAMVFSFAAFVALRLRTTPRGPRGTSPGEVGSGSSSGPDADDVLDVRPVEDKEVILGLTASATVRMTSGFLTFLIAFGLRREHSALWWYGVAFAASGAGALLGLYLVRRLRSHFSEQSLLTAALVLIALGAIVAGYVGTAGAEAFLALVAGMAGAIAQPSFDALTQRRIPPRAQGRVFARFAVRQQLAWVLGALIPVGIPMPFDVGDALIAAIAAASCAGYLSWRVIDSWRVE
jgi:hypothetical protein